MKILSIVGTRPQMIKVATMSREFKKHLDIVHVIVDTGQHYDKNLSEIFYEELEIPKPDHNLYVGSASHAKQTARILESLDFIFKKEKPDIVLVYGDTNSTLAGALYAVKEHYPVAHIEAGIRSYNRSMPEEVNRILTDHISDLLLCPTKRAVENLMYEGKSENTHFVGDIMFDSILYYQEKEMNKNAVSLCSLLQTHGISENNKINILTLHRAENTNKKALKSIFGALEKIKTKFVYPVHPRLKTLLNEIRVSSNVIIIPPISYFSMIWLLFACKKVFTDSGGLQKEAYFSNKQCITLRTETEWPETCEDNWNIIVGQDTNKIIEANKTLPGSKKKKKNVFGDGKAAGKIVKILKEWHGTSKKRTGKNRISKKNMEK